MIVPTVSGFNIDNFVNAIASIGNNTQKILETRYLTDMEKQALITRQSSDVSSAAQSAAEFMKAQQKNLLMIGGIAVAGFVGFQLVKKLKRK